jgi:RNA polymerase sigma-70 factor (ECF subfamily)
MTRGCDSETDETDVVSATPPRHVTCHISRHCIVLMSMTGDITDIWGHERAYLVDLAFRMLGNIQDAEDVVQDAFGRLLAQDLDVIDDARGWLIVVVSRLCVDQMRSARVRHGVRTADLDDLLRERPADDTPDPADRVTLDDTIGMALLVVLQQLSPAERAVFVLHDLFQLSFDDAAEIVGRTPAACRQLASRARKRIGSEGGSARFRAEVADHRRVAQRFIAACGGGDLGALLELLDADVVGDVDLGPTTRPRQPFRGRDRVARGILSFYGPESGTTLVSQPIHGHPGVLAFHGGVLVGILQMKTTGDRIHDLHAVADPAKLALVQHQLA